MKNLTWEKIEATENAAPIAMGEVEFKEVAGGCKHHRDAIDWLSISYSVYKVMTGK